MCPALSCAPPSPHVPHPHVPRPLQCKQLDDELLTQLQRHRALLNTCLEALTTYSQVTCHYPEQYCEENRSHAWSMALRTVCEADTPRVEE